MKTVNNDHGIPVNVCCASCAYKESDKGSVRICKKGRGCVKPSDSCGDWEMAEGLEKAGRGDGRVKKKGYLMWNAAEKEREQKLKNESAPLHKELHIVVAKHAENLIGELAGKAGN